MEMEAVGLWVKSIKFTGPEKIRKNPFLRPEKKIKISVKILD